MTPNINGLLASHHNCDCKYGAPMGRRNMIGAPGHLWFQQVALPDGGYDSGGAYWGADDPMACYSGYSNLWCAFNVDDDPTMIFVRGEKQQDAVLAVTEVLEEAGEDPDEWTLGGRKRGVVEV